MLGSVGLEQDPAGPPAAPGAPAHLMEQLIGALGRAHVAARQPQVGIHHAYQRKLWEVMPLGHHLRADQHVDLAGHDGVHEVLDLARAAHRIAGEHRPAGAGEGTIHLLGQPLDAGPAGREAVFGVAGGTSLGQRPPVVAMMAVEGAGEAMFHQPSAAVRAVEAVPAGAAEGQRRIAAAVEEEQRLLARLQRFGECRPQCRREPGAARGRRLAQVDRLDRRQPGTAVAIRQALGGRSGRSRR